MNWPSLIQRLEEINRQLQPLLAGPEIPPPRPNPPASYEELSHFEATRGLRLDHQHKAFLQQANGWRKFSCGTISLLGTNEMTGSAELAIGHRNLHRISRTAMGKFHRQREKLFVVGLSDATLDVLCMPVVGQQVQSPLIWFNNTEPDELPSFEAFFERAIDNGPAKLELFSKRRDRG